MKDADFAQSIVWLAKQCIHLNRAYAGKVGWGIDTLQDGWGVTLIRVNLERGTVEQRRLFQTEEDINNVVAFSQREEENYRKTFGLVENEREYTGYLEHSKSAWDAFGDGF